MERHLVEENRLWAALGVHGHVLKHGLEFVVAVKIGLIIFPILLPIANFLPYTHHFSPPTSYLIPNLPITMPISSTFIPIIPINMFTIISSFHILIPTKPLIPYPPIPIPYSPPLA